MTNLTTINWFHHSREDLFLMNKFVSRGFEAIFHDSDIATNRVLPSSPPNYPVTFVSPNHKIWRNDKGLWVHKDIDKNNIKSYERLKEILKYI